MSRQADELTKQIEESFNTLSKVPNEDNAKLCRNTIDEYLTFAKLPTSDALEYESMPETPK